MAEKLLLWCGGQAQEWSLYHAAGPYLVTLNAQIEAQTIVVNSAVSLDAILEYARYINFTQGMAKTNYSWFPDTNPISKTLCIIAHAKLKI